MKSIQLQNYERDGELYTVTLGNNHYFEFTSKKALDKFFVETNQFLTKQLVWVNQLIGDLYTRWRSINFYLDGKANAQRDHALNERIRNNITDVEQVFERIWKMCGTTNGNYNVFSQLLFVIDKLKDTVMALTQIYKRRCMTQQQYECGNVLQVLTTITNNLMNYGIDRAHGVTKPDYRFAPEFDAGRFAIAQNKILNAIPA